MFLTSVLAEKDNEAGIRYMENSNVLSKGGNALNGGDGWVRGDGKGKEQGEGSGAGRRVRGREKGKGGKGATKKSKEIYEKIS